MNDYEKNITEILNKIYPLSQQSVEQILQIVKVKQIEKMEDFVLLNSPNVHEYIVIEGICRSYITNYEGNEATLSFFLSGHVIPPNQTRTINDRSLFNIQALTGSSIVYFSRDEFANLMRQNTEVQKWGITISENELKSKVKKELELITLPAKERLIKFREKYPPLENLIPHQYIASYLGISPVSLSRLRSQKL